MSRTGRAPTARGSEGGRGQGGPRPRPAPPPTPCARKRPSASRRPNVLRGSPEIRPRACASAPSDTRRSHPPPPATEHATVTRSRRLSRLLRYGAAPYAVDSRSLDCHSYVIHCASCSPVLCRSPLTSTASRVLLSAPLLVPFDHHSTSSDVRVIVPFPAAVMPLCLSCALAAP